MVYAVNGRLLFTSVGSVTVHNGALCQPLYAIPGQSEFIGAPQNKKARVVRAKTEEKKCSSIL